MIEYTNGAQLADSVINTYETKADLMGDLADRLGVAKADLHPAQSAEYFETKALFMTRMDEWFSTAWADNDTARENGEI